MTTGETIGTWAWAKQTGGALSVSERHALEEQLKQAVAFSAAQTVARTDAELELTDKGMARVDIARIRIPDSKTARHAETLVAQLCPQPLANHCLRTYLWGSLLAQHDGVVVPDEEAFYVASLLHDLGLTPQHFCRHAQVQCFAVEGALAADEFLKEQNWPEVRREVVAEAICLHLNLLVELSHGPLAYYLSAGAKCDVVGARAEELPSPTISEVLRRHPGEDFAASFGHLLANEAQAHPQGRMRFLLEHLPSLTLFPFEPTETQRP